MNLSGSPLDFVWAFFAGILVSFTPCIYPLLPVTLAYVGISGSGSRLRGFTLSLVYVGGISLTYAILGLIAALTGTVFGRFSSLPGVRIAAGLIIVLFGLSLWTGRGVRLPAPRLPVFKKTGTYLSCFLLGLTSGLIISPCVAPALGTILTIVAIKKQFIYGAFLLFSFAYGMGSLLILTGTFGSVLATLPRSGHWMEIMKKICAVILIAAGIYFVFSAATNLAYAEETGITDTDIEINFSLSDLEGNTITLSKFRQGNPAILLFWTTWCPFCLRQLGYLSGIYGSLSSDNIRVLAINIQESKSKVSRFLQRNPLPFKVVLDTEGDVAYSYGLIGVPTYVLINKKGNIVFQDNYFPRKGYKDLLIAK